MSNASPQRKLPTPVRNAVLRTIAPYLNQRARKHGICSSKTRKERVQFYLQMTTQLWELGYRIRSPQALSAKHVTALMHHWHAQGLVANTLHTRLSMLRTLCGWLGKENVVKDITDYVPAEAARRSGVATASKAMEANGVDPDEIIERAGQIDERLAVILSMQHAFGLRVKEAIEIRPGRAVIDNGAALSLHEGTKGGRPRVVPIDSDYQRAVIANARRIAASGKTGRLRWTDCTWKQAQNRFYHYARRRLGISRKGLGVTAHALRHGYAQRGYRKETGLPSPIEGGALGRIDRATHQAACLTVAHALGHGRVDVTASYYGSYGHALRASPTDMTFVLKQRPPYA